MNCAGCGVEASFDSVDCIDGYDAGTAPRVVVDNGRICMECETFTCSRCFAAFELLGTEFADRDLCVTCNTAPIIFPVAPATAPALQLIRPRQKVAFVRASMRPEAVSRAVQSTTVKSHSIKTTAVLEHDGRGGNTAMFPFTDDSTDPEEIYLGRSVHPGYLDLPYVTEEVLANGHHSLGGQVAIADLSPTELRDLEKELADYERDFKAQMKALRRELDERFFALDVTGQLPLSIAA